MCARVCEFDNMNPTATTEKSNRSPKRVRTSHVQSDPKGPHPSTVGKRSPTKAAEDALERSVVSLPPSLQPLILHFGRKIIQIRSKLQGKTAIGKRMEDDPDYVPRSARASDFKLTVSKKAAEDTTRVEFLQGQVDQAKLTYEATLRNVVEECITLEKNALVKEEKALTSELLHGLASAVNTLEGAPCDPHLKVSNLLELDSTLFKHSPDRTKPALRNTYCAHHSIDELPAATLFVASDTYATPQQAAQAATRAATSAQKVENKGLTTLQHAIRSILVLPTLAFNEQSDQNRRDIELKKLATEIMDGKATDDTAMELDAEGGTSLEHLKDLIKTECNKRDKRYDSLAKKYNALEKQLAESTKHIKLKGTKDKTSTSNPKKGKPSGRGQGTSVTNNSNTGLKQNNRGRQKQRSNQEEADESSNASGRAKQKKRESRSRNKSKKKKPSSATGKNRQSLE